MKKIFQLISVATLTTSILALSAQVQASNTTSKTVSKTKSIAKENRIVAVPQIADEDDAEPNIQQSNAFEYKCELGNSLTLFTNIEDDEHVAMRWKKRLYRMTRIETSTGANRFENRKAGFVFIGIPAKGLLLDSHKAQQLANECKTTEAVLAAAPAVSETPAQPK